MEEIDLKELIAMFLEKKLLIILIAIIFALLGAIYTLNFITPIYQSTTKLMLVQSNSTERLSTEADAITQTDLSLNTQLVSDYSEVAKSRGVISKVIDNLGLDATIEEIQDSVNVTQVSDTKCIQITVSHIDPETSCNLANEVANVFIERANEIYKADNICVLDSAEIETDPSNINLTKNVVIFTFIGLILVSGYILLINMLDTTIKTDLDIQNLTGLPVLGSIIYTGDDRSSKKKKIKKITSKNVVNAREENVVKPEPKPQAKPEVPHVPESIMNLDKNDSSNKVEESVSLFSYVNNQDTNSNLKRPTPSTVDKEFSSVEIPVRRRRKGGRR